MQNGIVFSFLIRLHPLIFTHARYIMIKNGTFRRFLYAMKIFRPIKRLFYVCFSVLLLLSLAACDLKTAFCVHSFSETAVAATCANEGTLTKTCTKCGYSTTKSIPKTAHTYEGEWITTESPTCLKSGKAERVCAVCGFKDEKILPQKDHVIVSGDTVEPTCTEKGYAVGVCKTCGETQKGNYVDALGHDWGAWRETAAATSGKNGTIERVCKRCGKIETQTTVFYGHIDDSALSFDFKSGETPTVKSEAELQAFYKAAILNRLETATCNVSGFSVTNKTLESLAFKSAPFAYRASASATSSAVTITVSYGDLPCKTTSAAKRQTQYASANAYTVSSTRSIDFDGFKINASEKTYAVTYTDQLYYVLECGYKPLPVSGSPAERVYEKIKTVLREIISDDMTDFQKIRAIHDYIVMNVVYDNALYNLAYTATDVKAYDGFYLEGVFDDGVAVCDGISKAVSAMANIEGIPCVRVTGKKAGSSGNVGHAWNKVLINNAWYIVDATSDNVIVNDDSEVLSLEYFLITDEKMSSVYTADDYDELKANTDYADRYKDNSFKVLIAEYDFIVDSDAELTALIEKAINSSDAGGSVQFAVGGGYSGNVDSVVKKFAATGVRCLRLSSDGYDAYTYVFLKQAS